MGLEIDREEFSAEEYERFGARLAECLAVLGRLLDRTDFGRGPSSLGAELEVALVDQNARPLPLNVEILRESIDSRMTVELDRFNLECNLRHTDLAGRPFSHLRQELETARAELARAASLHGGRVAMIGILPTLVEGDLQSDAMTDAVRYRALSRSIRNRRAGEPFRLDIAGDDPLRLDCDDVTFEGAATSFQIHLRVDPRDFTAVFNAAQLATAPVLAAAGNSPTFLGHRLWDETRIALFKQAVDDRVERRPQPLRQARVNFGRGWLQGGAIELFRESVRDYPALLPVLYDEDPESALRAGQTPGLKEIRLHQGTVWHWNRPVYDPHEGGHVRMELRALPSGPTTQDMLANAAFLVGLSLGLAPYMDEIRSSFDFESAHRNFYRAAQSGLEARLEWPASLGGGSDAVRGHGEPTSIRTILPRLAEIARAGLRAGGVDPTETDALIDCLMERVLCGQTGSVWQRTRIARLEARSSRDQALARMLEEYLARSNEGEPVHRWSVA